MAYIGDEEYLSVWWPGPLPQDIMAGNYLDFLGPGGDAEEMESAPQATMGYIIRDWFGPFLLGPPLRCLRGRC